MPVLLLLAIVGVLGYRATTPEIRAELFHKLIGAIARARNYGKRELEPFREALRARTPRLLVTPALVAVNCVVCAGLLFSARTSNASALVGWGASIGPRTTNGEWWRLVSAMFAHGSLLIFAVNMAGIIQVGRLLERLVGRLTVLAAYLSAGLMAGLTTLALHPRDVSAGASSAALGLYGLLVVAFVAGRLHRSAVTVPMAALKRCAPIGALVVLVNLGAHAWNFAADLVGFGVGIAFGIATTRDVSEQVPEPRRIAQVAAAVVILAVALAWPLRGILDVQPELRRVVSVERRTTQVYDAEAASFKEGSVTAEGLAQFIDDFILPALHSADTRLAALRHVPPEDEASIAAARRYLQLRTMSWTLRAKSLRESAEAPEVSRKVDGDASAAFRARVMARHRSSELTRGKAEAAEREALETLGRITPTS